MTTDSFSVTYPDKEGIARRRRSSAGTHRVYDLAPGYARPEELDLDLKRRMCVAGQTDAGLRRRCAAYARFIAQHLYLN